MLQLHNCAWVDGSFNPRTNQYGCGGVLFDNIGIKHTFVKMGKSRTEAKMRNVGGEILGVKTAVHMAKELGMNYIKIFYDYEGVKNG